MTCLSKASNGFFVSETILANKNNPNSTSYYVQVSFRKNTNGLFAGFEQQAHSTTHNPAGAKAVAPVDGYPTIWTALTDSVTTNVNGMLVGILALDSDRVAGTPAFETFVTKLDSMVIMSLLGS